MRAPHERAECWTFVVDAAPQIMCAPRARGVLAETCLLVEAHGVRPTDARGTGLRQRRRRIRRGALHAGAERWPQEIIDEASEIVRPTRARSAEGGAVMTIAATATATAEFLADALDLALREARIDPDLIREDGTVGGKRINTRAQSRAMQTAIRKAASHAGR